MKIEDKLDKLWSKAVLLNYSYTCAYCGRTKETNQIHPHHVYGRRHKGTRWDIDNGIALCASHHTHNTKSAHKDPAWFMDEIRQIKGDKLIDDLRTKANTVTKLYKADLEHIEKELKDFINAIDN